MMKSRLESMGREKVESIFFVLYTVGHITSNMEPYSFTTCFVAFLVVFLVCLFFSFLCNHGHLDDSSTNTSHHQTSLAQ